MKAVTLLGEKRSGVVLRSLLALCILVFITGCKKDYPEPVIPNPPATLTFNVTPNKDTVKKGDSVLVTWTSKNAKICTASLNGVKQTLEVNGSKYFPITQNTFFEWTFTSEGTETKSSETKTFTFTVFVSDDTKPAPTLTLTSTPNRTEIGGSVTINIVATNYTSVSSVDIPGVTGPGQYEVSNLTETTTFHAEAIGEGGTVSKTITITVDPIVLPSKTDLLVFDRWYEDTVWYKNAEADPWEFLVLSNSEWISYHTDGTVNRYEPPNIIISYGAWWWSPGEVYLMGAYTNTVVRLDSTTLIIMRNEDCPSCPLGYKIVMRKFIHKPHN